MIRINKSIYPKDLNQEFELISNISYGWSPESDPMQNAVSGKCDKVSEPKSNLFAVLITGFNDTKEFWDDISNIYCAINQNYGYPKDNIFVHYVTGSTNTQLGLDLDGYEASVDIDYGAYFNELEHTFYCLGGLESDNDIPQLEPSDQLLVFVNGHGNEYSFATEGAYFMLPVAGKLYDTTLARWLSYIDCAQMNIVMEPCYAGGFNADLVDYVNYNVSCDNRMIHSSCDFDVSAPEIWVTDDSGNPNLLNLKFGEFVFYWTAAIRGYYPDFDNPWNVYLTSPTGTFPLENYFPPDVQHPGDFDPDQNGDGIVQMVEAFNYANFFDTWSTNGVFAPHDENPNHIEYPQLENKLGFKEDLLSMVGLMGEVNKNQTVDENYAIGGPLWLTNNATLTLDDNTSFYFIDNSIEIDDVDVDVTFDISAGASLILNDDVSVYGFKDLNCINVSGNIQFGSNNQFLSHTGLNWDGLNLLNDAASIVINGATFNRCGISGNPNYINLDYLDLSHSFIDLEEADVDLDYSDFDYSYFKARYGDRTSFVNVNNCDFYYANTDAIHIDRYFEYGVRNNTITNSATGLRVLNSGGGLYANILSNEISDNTLNGAVIYNSTANFSLNNIKDNSLQGIALHNNSYVKLLGNQEAKYVSETQRIRDNGTYDIYTDDGSFPEEFKWNAIIDEDNETDGYELVYCDSQQSTTRDARYNHWGTSSNFNPSNDFYPAADFLYLPTFKLDDDEAAAAQGEAMFLTAEVSFDQGNYTEAATGYQDVIEQHPESKFAKASVKKLLSVEELGSNNYSDLKQYYKTNSTIINNSDLKKLADFYANKCDIRLENWEDAIVWFEDRIENPDSYADSLYAIIDLGNTYLLMEQGGYKSSYSGKLLEHKPNSVKEYSVKRDYLISLLPKMKNKDSNQQSNSSSDSYILYQNIPNPFNKNTEIRYQVKKDCYVFIKVYDSTGQLIGSYNEGLKTRGKYIFKFNGDQLNNGIYFYTISLNGTTLDSKKMTIIR